MATELGAASRAIGALADGIRRRMYLFIRGRGAPVSRDEAAQEAGISTNLAAFHLDKLVNEGLLKAHYARPPGRGGPGAGRTSKLYEVADVSLDVSLPPRSYDLVGEILVAALESKLDEESPVEAARRAATKIGEDLGRGAAKQPSGSPGGRGSIERAQEALRDFGFEPRCDERTIRLSNCPFHALAERNRPLVCGLNEAFVGGVLEGLDSSDLEATLDPVPGQCCVVVKGDHEDS